MSAVSQVAFVGAFAFILATASSKTDAQDWVPLPDKTQVLIVEGQQVTISVRSEARFSEGQSGGIILNFRARARLDDFQAKVPDILRALAAKKSRCETRWSFPQLSPATVQSGKLKVEGQVRAEQWVCAGPLKTRVARETADFIIALRPVPSGSEMAVAAELEKFDLGNSMLSGVEDELKQALSSSLGKVFHGDGAKLRFPPEVASINPRFTAARLADAGQGKGELDVEAEALLRAADMAKIMALITR
jgi:hypothetical protein